MAATKERRGHGIMLANLRRLRERAGMSQRELEEASGIGHARISLLERGESGAQGKTIRKLAAALGASTADLVG